MKIGIVFGCFIPLHAGHMSLIDEAVRNNDRVIIGVCGSSHDRGRDFIPFPDRLALMKKRYSSEKFIVVPVDDEKIGMDGTFTRNNWIIWGKELFDQAGIDPNAADTTFTWYTGEESYREKLGTIYTSHIIKVADRKAIPISGTQIRSSVQELVNQIAPEFIDYLNKRKENDI